MNYQVKVGKDHEISLPDNICKDLEITIGDILICEASADRSSILMRKHCNQKLSDDEIASAGNLTRVIPYSPEP